MSYPYTSVAVGKGLFKSGAAYEKRVFVSSSTPELVTEYKSITLSLPYPEADWGKVDLVEKMSPNDLICVILEWLKGWSINSSEKLETKFGGVSLLQESSEKGGFKYVLMPDFFKITITAGSQHSGVDVPLDDKLFNLAVGLVSYRIGQTVERGRGQIEDRMLNLLRMKFSKTPDQSLANRSQVLVGNKNLDHVVAVLDFILHLSSNESYAWLRSGTITSLHRDAAVLHHMTGLISSNVLDIALYYALDIEIAHNLLEAIDVIGKSPADSIWMYCSSLGFVRRNKYSSTNMPAEFLYTSILCARYENNRIFFARYPANAKSDSTLLLGCLVCLYAGPNTSQGITLYYKEEHDLNPKIQESTAEDNLDAMRNIRMAITRYAILQRLAISDEFTAQEVQKIKSWVGEKYDRNDTLGAKIYRLTGHHSNAYLNRWVAFMEDKSYINNKSLKESIDMFNKKVGQAPSEENQARGFISSDTLKNIDADDSSDLGDFFPQH